MTKMRGAGVWPPFVKGGSAAGGGGSKVPRASIPPPRCARHMPPCRDCHSRACFATARQWRGCGDCAPPFSAAGSGRVQSPLSKGRPCGRGLKKRRKSTWDFRLFHFVFCRGVYVAKHTSQPANVRAFPASECAAAGCKSQPKGCVFWLIRTPRCRWCGGAAPHRGCSKRR